MWRDSLIDDTETEAHFRSGPKRWEWQASLGPMHFLAETVDHRMKSEVFLDRFSPRQSARAGPHLLSKPEE